MRERGLKLVIVTLQKTGFQSLPMRERGLKHALPGEGFGVLGVAPHAGAWIETYLALLMIVAVMSLPMRERGLKRLAKDMGMELPASLPMRERGLKPSSS